MAAQAGKQDGPALPAEASADGAPASSPVAEAPKPPKQLERHASIPVIKRDDGTGA